MAKPFPVPVRVYYDCRKCPGYCCTYSDIEITDYDIARLGKHFGLSPKAAEKKFTKLDDAKTAKILRHKQDKIFDSACMFFDQEKRCCTVYEVRPGVCRKYPDSASCGYYDFLRFERNQQDDKDYVALT